MLPPNEERLAIKPGMQIGTVSEVSFVVRPEMRAAFEGQVVHDVLSTAWMIVWMEWAARRIILPFLEPDEEGVGYEVNVRHIAPAAVGASATCRAVLTEVRGREIVTRVEADGPEGRIGEGTFTQMIVARERFRQRLQRAEVAARSEPTATNGDDGRCTN